MRKKKLNRHHHAALTCSKPISISLCGGFVNEHFKAVRMYDPAGLIVLCFFFVDSSPKKKEKKTKQHQCFLTIAQNQRE